jgi:hypothetical protein
MIARLVSTFWLAAGMTCLAAQGGVGTAPARAQDVAATDGFRVAILTSTAHVPSHDDIARLFARANEILFGKTGQRMVQVELADLGTKDRAIQLAQGWIDAREDAPPDGIILFADDPEVLTYGGYTAAVLLPGGKQNHYGNAVSPANMAFVAVIDAFHLYARCGYDNKLNHVSATSVGGECRGERGLTCVDNGSYWMCPDSTRDLNADHDYFIGCDIVHEFTHQFGSLGDNDHYGTRQCTERTGMSRADANDRTLFQQSCGICPDLFAQFKPRR